MHCDTGPTMIYSCHILQPLKTLDLKIGLNRLDYRYESGYYQVSFSSERLKEGTLV